MGKTNELVVVNDVLAKSACSHAHTAVDIAVELSLRTVIFFKICDELLGSVGKTKLLGKSLEILPLLKDLFLGGLIFEFYEYSRCVSVCNGNADALCSYNGVVSLDDLAVFGLTPNTEGLLLALLFLTADEGNYVVDHLGPLVEGLTRAGYSLISSSDNFLYTEFTERFKSGNVALNGAV